MKAEQSLKNDPSLKAKKTNAQTCSERSEPRLAELVPEADHDCRYAKDDDDRQVDDLQGRKTRAVVKSTRLSNRLNLRAEWSDCFSF